MKIKKIITCGCSFSDSKPDPYGQKYTWPHQLEAQLKSQYGDTIEFEHLGIPSQGQELIQKKTTLALTESLKKYKAEEIAVVVMWSGTERKSFYVDNPYLIKNIVKEWDTSKQFWHVQFADLKNNFDNIKQTGLEKGSNYFYNDGAGWYICAFGLDTNPLTTGYFSANVTDIAAVHLSIENIIFLQNFCRLHNVKLYNQFYRTYVYQDIEDKKDHQIVGYLFDQFDRSKVITYEGMHEYLRYDMSNIHPADGKTSGIHPNRKGHEVWTTDVLMPRLKELGLFDE